MNEGSLRDLREPIELSVASQSADKHELLLGAVGAGGHQNTSSVHHPMDVPVHTLTSAPADPYNRDSLGRERSNSIPTVSHGECVPVTSSVPDKYLRHLTGFDAGQAMDLSSLSGNLPAASYLPSSTLPHPPLSAASMGVSQLFEKAPFIAHGNLQANANPNQNYSSNVSVQSIPHIPISGMLPTKAHNFPRDGTLSPASSNDSGIGSSSFLRSMDQSSCPITSTSSAFQSSRSQSVSLAAPGPIPPSTPSLISQSFSGTSRANAPAKDLQTSVSLSSQTRSAAKSFTLLGDSLGGAPSQDGNSMLAASISEPRSLRKAATRRVECSIRKTTTERVTVRELPADGYCWRKYGSKRLPNNSHPKSYFRCSVPGCQAKRYVTETDNRVLKTEYIGEHNHGKSSSTTHEAANLADVCRLAALGQNFLIKSDLSLSVLSKTFLDLAVLIRPSVFGNDYLILNGFGSIVLDDSDKRYRDPINGNEIIEISDNIYPLSALTSMVMAFFAKGVELSNAVNLAIAQLNKTFREKSMYTTRKQDARGHSHSDESSLVAIPSEDPSTKGSSAHAPRGRKLIISCKLPSYDQIESGIDFFRWKKYGHKPQTDTRLDSKSYYRCAFFNCPARRTITFFYSLSSDGTETIESMIVQYENQHTHSPDRTRMPYKDCLKLLKASDHLSTQPLRSPDHPIFANPASYLGVTGVTVAQRPVFTSLTTHMTTPIGDPTGHHPLTMQHGMPAPVSHGITDINTVTHGAQVVPSMHRSDSFERASCLFFPRVDSMVLQEGFSGLHADQNLYGRVSTSPGYGASYPFAAQPDCNSYSLVRSNSFLLFNQLGTQSQLDQVIETGHPSTVGSFGSTSKIPSITPYPIHSSNMEKDLLSYCSTIMRGDENMNLTSAENESMNRMHDALLGPMVNVYS